MIPPLVAFVAALAAGPAPAAGQSAAPSILNVPFLAQTEALCGGAAAAMLFRYWGERRADVQQFAPLVDRRAGGIAQDVLVEAIRRRGWQAAAFEATIHDLRRHLAAGQPLILLIEDRPQRYHYVIAVGADAGTVTLHDPAWGPFRTFTHERLIEAWRPARFWALLVTPGTARDAETASSSGAASPAAGDQNAGGSECDVLLDAALADIGARGLQAADEALGRVRKRCPDDGRAYAELAAVRFTQRDFVEAAALAADAVARDAGNAYAWDVLGSTRYMLNDPSGALRAWNRAGKPRLDSVQIEGLTRTRYAFLARTLPLTPGSLLEASAYRRAERRIRDLPAAGASRIGLRPHEDGYATVDVVVSEQPRMPAGAMQWTAAAIEAAIGREAAARVPGWTGHGELWSVSWRWWSGRPRAAISFAAPRVGFLPGIWRVDGSWETQTYASSIDGAAVTRLRREEHLHGGLTVADWLDADLSYSAGIAADSWDGDRRAVTIAGSLERRLLQDRVALSGSLHRSFARRSPDFHVLNATTRVRSSAERRGLVVSGVAAIDWASEPAPLSMWPGAGGGQARTALLRAHPLLNDGVIAGPAFGRRLQSAGAEVERWFQGPAPVRSAVSAFVDVARAARPLAGRTKEQVHVDAGIGFRIQVPGSDETFRVDYARGLRDGTSALTVGVARDLW